MTGNRAPVVELQDRDRRLLDELAIMRVINREQAQIVAGFRSTTRANERLLALTRIGLLSRILIEDGRALYFLAGSLENGSNKKDRSSARILFARHQLAINDLYLACKYRPIPHGRLIRWVRFSEPLSKAIPLIPDSYLEIETNALVRPMFLEVDLGTEALPVLQKKVQLYLQLAVSGEFAKVFGQPQFRVLLVLHSDRRLESVRVLTAKITDKIFWFSTFDNINRDGFWSPIWLRPTGTMKQSLL